jgi:hypothetical protein
VALACGMDWQVRGGGESDTLAGEVAEARASQPEQPIMRAALSQQPLVPAVAASTVGIAVSWLMMTPFGLVAPSAAFFLLARGRTALLLHAMSAAGLVGSLLLAALYAGAMRDVAQAWAAFFAVALCIGVIVRSSESAPASAEASTRTKRRPTQSSAQLPEKKSHLAPRRS